MVFKIAHIGGHLYLILTARGPGLQLVVIVVGCLLVVLVVDDEALHLVGAAVCHGRGSAHGTGAAPQWRGAQGARKGRAQAG